MFSNNFLKTKRTIVGICLAIVVAVQSLGFLLAPAPAYATGVPVVDAVAAGQRSRDSVLDYIGKTLWAVGLGGVLNGVSYMARKLAYDTARYIGSGGKGQTALVFQDGVGEYLQKTAADSAATMIDSFGKPFGLNLCKPPNIATQVQIQVGLRVHYDARNLVGTTPGPQPSCTWQDLQVSNHFSALGEAGLKSFNNVVDVRQTDFGVTLAAIEKIDRFTAVQKQEKLLERTIGDGFKSVKGRISGNIKTPASVVAEEAKGLTSRDQSKITYGQIAGVYGSRAREILPMVGSIFLNTLLSESLNTLLTEGLVPDKPADGGGTGGIADFYASAIVSNKKAVEQAFNFLFTAVPQKEINDYEVLDKLAACPPGATELLNCVIDSKMQDAIERGRFGDAMTIQEALDEGLLKSNGILISPFRVSDNTDENCYQKGYCYSNVQKLRKLRVLPLGFEIAALRSPADDPWKLGDVVKGFNKCKADPNDPSKTVYAPDDEKYQYCHLIDPNWIIRLPQARCEALVHGPQLLSANSPERRDECADISTCINEGPNGECGTKEDTPYYGYCTKERNVWHIGQDSCPAHANTCKTYVDSAGTARSYLSRTVDFGQCDVNSVGCRAYSLEKTGVGTANETWKDSASISPILKTLGRNQTMFFNSQIENFTAASCGDGCTAFYQAVPDGANGLKKKEGKPTVYLQKAPDYLGCYDADTATDGIQPPTTLKEIADMNRPAECSNYAQICLPEETACQQYAPFDGGTPVPGIIGSKFACKSECVGYDAFKQQESFFEKSQYPVYYIPSAAQSCSAAEVGCDEFTNLEGGETLEYYSKIKYCEKPDGFNQKTYYSWEGDAASGFVLRVHKLLQIDKEEFDYITGTAKPSLGKEAAAQVFAVGSPAYAEDAKKKLEGFYAECNEVGYTNLINNAKTGKANPDCRALYDEDGNVFYRLLAQTVTVSNECQRLRKTNPYFEVDPDIGSKAACDQKKGFWNTKVNQGQCERCKGGGEYENGSCVYAAITGPNESVSCSAAAAGCREYRGPGSNDVEPIFNDDFEPDSTGTVTEVAQYSPDGAGKNITVVAEAIQVGLNSLQVNATSLVRKLPKDSIDPNKGGFYELSFWARGAPMTVSVVLAGDNLTNAISLSTSPITGQEAPSSISNDWREYKLGPIQIEQKVSAPQLVFSAKAAGSSNVFFIDNVRLNRYADRFYRIKDSWKQKVEDPTLITENTCVQAGGSWSGTSCLVETDVPLSCDATPTDAFPGQALGCQAYTYTDQNANPRVANATGFEKLCRPEAIGCEPLFDSHNTVEIDKPEQAHVFNMECSFGALVAQKTTTCKLELNGTDIDDGTCEIKPGESKCLVEHIAVEKASDLNSVKRGTIGSSTVVIPEDSKDDLLYLTNRNEYHCSAIHQGCQKVALEEAAVNEDGTGIDYAFKTEFFVLNNPDTYLSDNSPLCAAGDIGCEAFRQDDLTTFFKDPIKTGNRICEYRENVIVDGNEVDGWFRAGQDKDVLCYANYVDNNGDFGIWSNKSFPEYQGYVGMCGSQYNGCTELVDPADTTNDEEGEPYYVLYNEDLKEASADCNGQASLKEGCVLFDRTEVPKKNFSTDATYKKSESKAFGFVEPVSQTGKNDANLILKVSRDRQCSEWLACKTSVPSIDEKGRAQQLCYGFKACDSHDKGKCDNFLDDEEIPAKLLTEKDYVERQTSWFDEDFTGYSLLNRYPVSLYDYVTVEGKSVLGYTHDSSDFAGGNANLGCSGGTGNLPNWTTCGLKLTGRCIEGVCIEPIDGPFPTDVNNTPEGIKKGMDIIGSRSQCKAFPEKTSPFPQTVLSKGDSVVTKGPVKIGDKNLSRSLFVTKESGFSQANVCQSGECSCKYVKVEYSGAQDVDYWPAEFVKSVPEGVCTGTGEKEGLPCATDVDCKSASGLPGSCGRKRVQETHLGLDGFCLEYDLSRPIEGFDEKNQRQQYACLTWLPIDVSPGGVDLANNVAEAGYYPAVDAKSAAGEYGKLYCTDSNDIGTMTLDRTMFRLMSCDKGKGECSFDGIKPNNSGISSKFNQSASNIYFSTCHTGFSKDDDCGNKHNVESGRIPIETNYSGGRTPASHDFNQNMKPVTGDLQSHLYSMVKHTMNANPYVLNKTEYDKDLASVFLEKENTFVWYMDNPKAMTNYFSVLSSELTKRVDTQSVCDPFASGYTPCQGKFDHWHLEDDSGTFGKPKNEPYVLQQYHYYKQFKGKSATVSKDPYLHPGAKNVREADIRVMYFNPFVAPPKCWAVNYADEGIATHTLIKYHCSFFEDVPAFGWVPHINFAQLKSKAIDSKEDFVFSSYDFQHNYFTSPYGPGAGDNVTVDGKGYYKFYAFRGEVSKDKNRVRYGLLLTTESYIEGGEGLAVSEDDVKQKITAYLTEKEPNNTKINSAFGGKKIAHVAVLVDFDAATGKLLSNLPLKAYGIHNDGYAAKKSDFDVSGRGAQYFSNFINVGGTPAVGATIEPNSRCIEINTTYDADQLTNPSKHTDKAWTDRIWEHGKLRSDQSGTTPLIPFGSLPLASSDLPHAGKTGAGAYQHSFENPAADGAPYQCTKHSVEGFISKDNKNILESFINESASAFCGEYIKGAQFDPEVRFRPLSTNYTNLGIQAKGLQRLKTLFAKLFDRFIMDDGVYKDTGEVDEAGFVSADARPPQIYSLNPYNCFRNQNAACGVGEENNITINARNGTQKDYDTVPGPDEDPTNVGAYRAIIEHGSVSANLNFFAFADHNRMPIKRVMVHWDDNDLTNNSKYGRYKNHKPYCDDSDGVSSGLGICAKDGSKTQLTCKTDTECPEDEGFTCDKTDKTARFGNAPRACQEDYFQYVHTYTCPKKFRQRIDASQSEINNSVNAKNTTDQDARDWAGKELPTQIRDILKKRDLSGDDEVCVYKPKVQVLDNWGWCNGDCSTTADGNTGCYADGTKEDVGGFQAPNDQCDPYDLDPNADPWTEYQGLVVVIPKK